MPKSGSRSLPDVTTLAQEHDCLLLDLDGTVFRGHEPTPGAVDTLAAVTARTLYVTNNASRGPSEVAQHLRDDGLHRRARRRRHQCPERRPSAGRAAARRGARCSSSAPNRWPPRSQTSASSPSGCGRTTPSPSSRAIHPRPHGPTWPRPPWRSGAARCGSRPTSTGRCPRNGACFPETARWSRRCRRRPTASRRSQASRSRHC